MYGMFYDMCVTVLQGRVKTVWVIAMKKCFHMEYRCKVSAGVIMTPASQ